MMLRELIDENPERPDDYFRYARIEVVDKTDSMGTGMTEKVFSGPLDRQLRDALSYIQNYVLKEKVTKIPGRAEAERIYNYPYAAIEEVLSNAVYHKSYQIGEPITVKVTDAVGKAIRELLNEQKIVYLDPDNPRSRHQRLRLNNPDGPQ